MRDSSIKYLVSINTELIKKNLDDIYLKKFDNDIPLLKESLNRFNNIEGKRNI